MEADWLLLAMSATGNGINSVPHVISHRNVETFVALSEYLLWRYDIDWLC